MRSPLGGEAMLERESDLLTGFTKPQERVPILTLQGRFTRDVSVINDENNTHAQLFLSRFFTYCC